MSSSYSISPHAIGMEQFYDLLSVKQLLPGRLPLRQKMEERFNLLINQGIQNMAELLIFLNSKKKIHLLSGKTGIPPDYLVLLRREAQSYIARPFLLSDFPGIPHEYVEVLKSKGVKNTRVFFESAQTDEEQRNLSVSTGIPLYRITEILCLCDLSRINGVGGVFARIIYEAGIHSVEILVRTDIENLIRNINTIIKKHKYTSNQLSERDLGYCLDYARIIINHPLDHHK